MIFKKRIIHKILEVLCLLPILAIWGSGASICPWCHRETVLRLPKKTTHYFGEFWCYSQLSQLARTNQKSSKTRRNIKLCCLRYYKPLCTVQSVPSPILQKIHNLSPCLMREELQVMCCCLCFYNPRQAEHSIPNL